MNRIDSKYWFCINKLEQILQHVISDYYILVIDGKDNLPYTSTYFDTINNSMYNAHHNGKQNRYKIRKRSYISSGISFMEVKFKSNKGRTIKKRISSEFGNTQFTLQEIDFIKKQTPYDYTELQCALINDFSRITLVNKNFKERCTIDLNIQFKYLTTNIVLDQLVILEIKSEGNYNNSPLAIALREERIKKSGISKYCIGRAIVDPQLKQNRFKEKVIRIDKTIQKEKYNYN